jgi:F0F1-type ATP synthase delta subunit
MELEIPNLDTPAQRKQLVRALTIFRKLRKISRHRADKLFARTQSGVLDSLIITGQPIEKDEEKYLLNLFKRSFPHAHKPTLSINPKLQGGVRMSYGDEMVELSLNQLRITN